MPDAMTERLVPRHNKEEGASAPTSAERDNSKWMSHPAWLEYCRACDACAPGKPFPNPETWFADYDARNKYGRWFVDAPKPHTGPHGHQSGYIAGSYDDVRRIVERDWPARTRIVYAPNPDMRLARPEERPTIITAQSICQEAARLVGTDRRPKTADPLLNFRTVALLWNAYRACKELAGTDAAITPHDVSSMMELFKIGRRFAGYNADNYIDGAGYSGTSGELAIQEALVHGHTTNATRPDIPPSSTNSR